jgi:hypothetical protein
MCDENRNATDNQAERCARGNPVRQPNEHGVPRLSHPSLSLAS